ncbi:MAG: hypothetical protein NZM25_05100 [Leptospiraceae bacterium]|nr:hypothetical protein [Leptospiraceae bacterium]MDW8305615.1 hypothetical protein [Leptospiraceae bacterium]
MASKDIAMQSLTQQLRRMRSRFGGKRVITEDINKLKGLAVKPQIPASDIQNYYVEPVTIEYYIPKESRFAYEIKYLYIPLYDPEPRNSVQEEIMGFFQKENRPMDTIEIMNRFPQHLPILMQYFSPYIHLHEALSLEFQQGFGGDKLAFRRALYLSEVLHKYEPSLPSLEILGPYTLYNIQWCIRYLNQQNIEFTLEDATTEFLITRHRNMCQLRGEKVDERFEILANIYLEQAFPYAEEDLELD